MSEPDLSELHESLLEMLVFFDHVAQETAVPYTLAYGTALGAVRESGFIKWDGDADLAVLATDLPKLLDSLREACTGTNWTVVDQSSDDTYELLFPRLASSVDGHYSTHIDIFPFAGTPTTAIGRRCFRFMTKAAFKTHYYKNLPLDAPDRKYSSFKKFAGRMIKIALFPIPSALCKWQYNRLAVRHPANKSGFVHNIGGSYGSRETIPVEWVIDQKYVAFEGKSLPVPHDAHAYLTQIYGDYLTPRQSSYLS